ncbi:autophagy-related protein 13-domain-containing protein [Phanerochaete sordida]|uniref:Autophagy-related protein 13 n=1 Tax=Phanerochaete sordida TaxID=48140 RepID=A0A9P3GCZ2_9APHY|nr:autophagy-related protein 13-domain-containing protein [Phanerochaete sordida]
MSNDTTKADQIAYRFFTKLALVVHHARATHEPNPQARADKWFNLETPDTDVFKEHTRIYRTLSTTVLPSTFRLQVLLAVPELTPNQVLAHIEPDSSRVPIDPTPRFILLETWTLVFEPHQSQAHLGQLQEPPDVAPPTIYKHGISLFRSIFTLLRILPTWKHARRGGRLRGMNNGNFSIQVRVEQRNTSEDGVLAFDSLVQGSPLAHQVHDFPPVPHPRGTLSLSAMYLSNPDFKLFDRESLLSSRFLSQAEGPEFTPTLLRNQQRDSLTSSPGSLPMRTSLPRSPPSSVAERFVLPPRTHTRTTSLTGSSPRSQNVALPMTRALSGAGTNAASASGVSDTSSIRHGTPSIGSREEMRYRRDSFGIGRSDSPAPMPIRRPALTPINAFKSGTMSSGSPSVHSPSTSLRQHSPLNAGPSLPSRPVHSSPTSSRAPALPSPIGAGATSRLPGSPVPLPRPSPPTIPASVGGPSSLGDRRSLEGTSTPSDSSPLAGGRRYRSSFGHRFATPPVVGVGSEGSTSSAPERPAHASYRSTTTDDDDISDFVQQIDRRKPLHCVREASHDSASSPVEPASSLPPEPGPAAGAGHALTREGSQPMLTSASAVDEKLQQMSDTFFASLNSIGTRRRRDRERDGSSTGSSTARAPSSGPSTLGRRTLDPITLTPHEGPGASPPLARRPSGSSPTISVGVPAAYRRPRLASTGSATSNMSIASAEVLGRMDPEIDDERRRSRGGRDWTG